MDKEVTEVTSIDLLSVVTSHDKPFVIIDGDVNDLRLYSEEQTRTNIEAFVEQLSQG